MTFEKALADEIARIRKRLEELMAVGESLGAAVRRPHKAAAKPRARRKLSPKVRAQRVLQGKYMGAIRNLPAAAKKKVSTIRENSGYQKAIAEAKRIAARR